MFGPEYWRSWTKEAVAGTELAMTELLKADHDEQVHVVLWRASHSLHGVRCADNRRVGGCCSDERCDGAGARRIRSGRRRPLASATSLLRVLQ
jgi:hypothetical protein